MIKTYDWIVVGGGITGAALGYELVNQGFKVLLIEKDFVKDNATSYSYGGLAYWSGTTDLSRQLCLEAKEIYRNLSSLLDAEIEFREIDLLLTVDKDQNPVEIAANYKDCLEIPEVLTPEEACKIEPLLNPGAIAGALKLPHGQINPVKTNNAYLEAFSWAKGEIVIDRVIKLLKDGDPAGTAQGAARISGVETQNSRYYAANTVVCAGGLTRNLLKQAGIDSKIYFNHAQIIQIPPVDFKLNALIMPAVIQRFGLEKEITKPENEQLWELPSQEKIREIVDGGVIQFKDGSLFIGQITQIISDPEAVINLEESEKLLRQEIGKILPRLENLPGVVKSCLVAFSNTNYPQIGRLPNLQGLHLFSGLTSTLVFAPTLAKHFASFAKGEKDEIMISLAK